MSGLNMPAKRPDQPLGQSSLLHNAQKVKSEPVVNPFNSECIACYVTNPQCASRACILTTNGSFIGSVSDTPSNKPLLTGTFRNAAASKPPAGADKKPQVTSGGWSSLAAQAKNQQNKAAAPIPKDTFAAFAKV